MSMNRRDFFKRLLLRHDIGGIPASLDPSVPGRFRLEMLKFLPESVLRELAPEIRRGYTIAFRDGGVAYRGESGDKGLVHPDPDAYEAAKKFDGRLSLAQIARAMETERGWTPGDSFSRVRTIFLALAARGVCHPSGPLPSDGEVSA